jgi:hypothetical protein
MTGQNLPLTLPPGIFSDVSRYMAKNRWWDGNLVRWNENGVMVPVGGNQKLYDVSGPAYPIRDAYSWRDNDTVAYVAYGSLDKAIIRRVSDNTSWDATPTDLVFVANELAGYGANQFGQGRYGIDTSVAPTVGHTFDGGYWTFDSWGEDLLGLHSKDGRLLQWSPNTPTSDLAAVTNAPTGNRLVITTDERHVMVMGGNATPRRVKWCSREAITDWTATATNSAGGFELDSNGLILAAIKVPQGILVLTDIDVHLIEYVGRAGGYYSRRLVSSETGIVGQRALAALPNGVLFAGQHSFWRYTNGLERMPCSVAVDVFRKGNLAEPDACFMGINEAMQELWFFFPAKGDVEANRAVYYRFSTEQQWWSKAEMTRSAWLNPIWQTRPIAVDNLAVYEHERGWTDNGTTRTNIFAETGAFDISNGDYSMFVDRMYHDTVAMSDDSPVSPVPYNVEFILANAPQGAEYTNGPITLNSSNGYTNLRFKARQLSMRVKQIIDQEWGFGQSRLRIKAAGRR